ncbi:hypothetical protein JIN82_10990 [Persicirhabdus sediminis]|uniref:Uncharacterized protein n=1 Tax=Persicirhabdus sediminis TaxID=454144 RepID=A0A8J7MFB7_9BACT|nr:hypothetical protein [Persicirhabdus sediminis]
MKAEFTDFIENTYHREIDSISISDLDGLLHELTTQHKDASVSLVLSRSDADYISVDLVGENVYLVQFERIAQNGSFFTRLFKSSNISKTIDGLSATKQLAHDYMVNERLSFEKMHS